MSIGFALLFRDRGAAVTTTLAAAFGDKAHVSTGDIFAADFLATLKSYSHVAIVSPANSFGFMDGGIDAVYTAFFGQQLQDRLQQQILQAHNGELIVGDALTLSTEDQRIQTLVSAPTMRTPHDVSNTVNAYLAYRAALLAVRDFNRRASAPIDALICPGLGTSIGRMPAARAAQQMRMAYDNVETPVIYDHLHEAAMDENEMLR